MPLTITSAAIGLTAKGIGMYDAYSQKKASEKQAREEARRSKYLDFKPTIEQQQVYSTATNDVNNARGYTSSETANFRNSLAENTNTTLYNANRATGGGMSRYLSAGLNTRNIGALNNFAAQDARLRIQNRNSALGRQQAAAGVMQGVNDRNVQAKNYRKQLIEQALGGAIAQQNQNLQQGIADIGQLGFTGLGYGLSGGFGSGTTNTTFNNVMQDDIFKNQNRGIKYTPSYGNPY